MTTTAEFAVQMSCESCVSKIENSLKNVDGIKNVKISKEDGTVLVESNLPSNLIKEKIESSGRKAVLKGYGSDSGEHEDTNLEKVELISGCCTLCKPDPNSSNIESNDKNKKPAITSSTLKDDSKEPVGSSENGGKKEDKTDDSDTSEQLKKEKSKTVLKSKIEPKSDDEEELELKYSSDSDNEDLENRNLFNSGDGDDIWKIDEEDFDVIDADGGDSMDEGLEQEKGNDKSEDLDKSSSKSPVPKKRKITHQSDNVSSNESEDEHKSDVEKDSEANKKKTKLPAGGGKSFEKIKSSLVRRGDFNLKNSHIHQQALIIPEKEEEYLKEEDAQMIKDTLCKELFKRGHQLIRGEPGIIQLRFTDCKLVQPGWLLISCDDQVTYDWLLAWKIPSVDDKCFKSIPALDKTPTETIKFNIKSSWIPNDEAMLNLIRLQNRNIDTKRWVLKDKKPTGNSMDQFKFEVDAGTIRSLEKINWCFFYELFTVKITEHNGKAISAIMRTGKIGSK